MPYRLVDSSAWIEWLLGTPLGIELGNKFPERADWIVPTIVQFEVFKWLNREVSAEAGNGFLSQTQLCKVVNLDTELAVRAAIVSTRHKLAGADAIIYATMTAFDADLLTCDVHFAGLPQVVYLPKIPN